MARDLALERAWRGRVRRQEKSGLTIQAFCQQEDLAPHQFSWWRRELKRRDGQARKPKRAKGAKPTKRAGRSKRANRSFVAVEVARTSSSPAAIEIVLDTPPRIAVSAGFDPQLLRDVLRVMENASC